MIRLSSDSDANEIRDLLNAAFRPSRYESRLREIVIGGGREYTEWVVEQSSRIVAHILYTPATRDSDFIGYHLAPVAVHPEFQGQGIGSILIRETLNSEPVATSSVFVLGDPGFYERFGFTRPDSACCPFDSDNEHFRALRWEDVRNSFSIGYDPAFQQSE